MQFRMISSIQTTSSNSFQMNQFTIRLPFYARVSYLQPFEIKLKLFLIRNSNEGIFITNTKSIEQGVGWIGAILHRNPIKRLTVSKVTSIYQQEI